MMILFTFLACVAMCVANVVPSLQNYHSDGAWADYKQRFGKIYTSQNEEQMRYEIWAKQVDEMTLHNSLYGQQYEQGRLF